MQHYKKTPPIIHNAPEFKELRKKFQGINATSESSKAKSIKRHMAKKMKN